MSDILIKNMKMPKTINHPMMISIRSDGSIQKIDTLNECFVDIDAKAVALPKHGDLIDRRELLKLDNITCVDTGYWVTDYDAVKTSIIKNAPVIVEATDG